MTARPPQLEQRKSNPSCFHSSKPPAPFEHKGTYPNTQPVQATAGTQTQSTATLAVARATKIRCSIVVSISACHAEDPGSIPGGGVLFAFASLCATHGSWIQANLILRRKLACDSVSERLRRWTRNPLGSARRGSNPLAVVFDGSPAHRSRFPQSRDEREKRAATLWCAVSGPAISGSRRCISRESSPGHINGNNVFYH